MEQIEGQECTLYIDSKVFLKTFHKFLKHVVEKLSIPLENLDSLEQFIRNIHSPIYNFRVRVVRTH